MRSRLPVFRVPGVTQTHFKRRVSDSFRERWRCFVPSKCPFGPSAALFQVNPGNSRAVALRHRKDALNTRAGEGSLAAELRVVFLIVSHDY